MRMGCGIAGIVIATAACGSSAAAAATTRTDPGPAAARCGPAGARTLAVDSRARIYARGGNVYGCASGGHAYLLGHNGMGRPGQDRVGRVALAGMVAGYAISRMGVDTLSSAVVVRRLDTGSTLHEFGATTQPTGPEFFQSVGAIVVKPDGAVAWIADSGSILRKESTTEVDRADRRGEANLDSTAAGDISSLRLRGSRLTWRHGARLRSATLL